MIVVLFCTLGIGLVVGFFGLLSSLSLMRPVPVSAEPGEQMRLSQVADDMVFQVIGLDHQCIGSQRRRLMDLGVTRGADMARQLSGPFGGMAAYRLRGTLIALRDEQADQIIVELQN